jgi:hypothetical protein
VPVALGGDHSGETYQRIGFVFPVYGFAPPRIVEDFIRKSTLPHGDYHFAVVSSGGTAGPTNRLLADRKSRMRSRRRGNTVQRPRIFPPTLWAVSCILAR